MNSTTLEQTQQSQAPPTAEQTLKERQTGVERWEKFEQRITDKPEPLAKNESEGTLTTQQRQEWNDAKAEAETSAAKSETGKEQGEAKPEDAKKSEAAKEPAKVEPEPPQSGYDKLLEKASKQENFDQIVERLHEPIFPLSQEGYARYQVLNYAMSQVSNPADVTLFLADPANSSVVRSMQDAEPWRIAAAVHGIAADLKWGAKRAEKRAQPKPSAPRPVSEVGGRGVAADDPVESAERRGDFKELKNVWNRQAMARGK